MRERESTLPAGAVLLAVPPDDGDALLWSPVAGRPLLAWPLAALRAAPEIGPIALVVPPLRLEDAARLIAVEGIADVDAIALPPGGQLAAAFDLTQTDLTSGAARHPLSLRERGTGGEVEPTNVVVLHDAACPLISADAVAALVAAAARAGLAAAAEAVKETIKRVAGGWVVETLPRAELAQLISPLAVRADLLPALLAAARYPSPTWVTDSVAAALGQGIAVHTVALAGTGLAVRSPEDLAVAAALLGRAAAS